MAKKKSQSKNKKACKTANNFVAKHSPTSGAGPHVVSSEKRVKKDWLDEEVE